MLVEGKSRFDEFGEVGLLDRASVPHLSPTQLDPDVVALIEGWRRDHKWSARAIHLELARRDQMLDAAESPSAFDDLRALVQALLDSGTPAEVLLDDLGQIRGLVTSDQEEVVLDVMGLLTGWCAPGVALRPKGESGS